MIEPRDPGELSADARFLYLAGYTDATEDVTKHVDALLARHKYGWDIDSRLLLDEIAANVEDVISVWGQS